MEEINSFVNQNPLHLTTNTIILIAVAVVAIYILIKAIGNLIKIAAMLAVCYFVLMSLQSTNIISIPIIKQTYAAVEKVLPSKELWTEAVNKVEKINKVVDDLK